MSTTDFTPADPEITMYCANHPTVETYLRCGKCEKPICARCRVSTPVGFRCFDCARLQVLPTYAISPDIYLRAALAGLAAAAVTGALMGLFPAFEFWVALLMGIVVPEAIAFASNQKRGPGIQWVAAGCIIFGFAWSRLVLNTFPFLIPLGGVNFPYPSSIDVLNELPFYVTQYTILWLAMSIFLAVRRLG